MVDGRAGAHGTREVHQQMNRRNLIQAGAIAGGTLALGHGTSAQVEGTPPTEGVTMTQDAPQTGYAPVNGLEMYYEIHGEGGFPLLLLHGGLFNIDLQFGPLLPGLSADRQVIAADFQAHGRTNDIDRPLSAANLASDIEGLLQHLGVPQVDPSATASGARSRWNSRSTTPISSARRSSRPSRSAMMATGAKTPKRWGR
jgi:hypothetical protein